MAGTLAGRRRRVEGAVDVERGPAIPPGPGCVRGSGGRQGLRVSRASPVFLVVSRLLLLTLAACQVGGRGVGQTPVAPASEPASLGEHLPGLTMGRFALAPGAVVDGDTLRVVGLDASLRLLGIDTEETFKKKAERRAYERGWQGYWREAKRASSRPIKLATPLGMEARDWAARFFEGVREVRLERDHPGEIRGRYGRFLCYVFVQRDGGWSNYNVEAVRAGMSPYFTKYGYSRRFHGAFVEAQNEARGAGRGIWRPGAEAYDDYALRLRWWQGRADFIQAFERAAEGRRDRLVLTRFDARRRLTEYLGREVTVLAAVGEPRKIPRGPWLVPVAYTGDGEIDMVVFDEAVYARSRIADFKGELVQIRAPVSRYVSGRDDAERLQLVLRSPEQLTWPTYQVPGSFGVQLPEQLDAPAPAPAGQAPDPGPASIVPSSVSDPSVDGGDETPPVPSSAGGGGPATPGGVP